MNFNSEMEIPSYFIATYSISVASKVSNLRLTFVVDIPRLAYFRVRIIYSSVSHDLLSMQPCLIGVNIISGFGLLTS